MHPSQYEHMKRGMARYLPEGKHLDVLELGSATSPGQTRTHRSLFDGIDHDYFGVDVRDGPTVDAVMRQPYSIPARSKSQDVVVCGSVLEHVPFFWVSILEMNRVLRVGGLIFITVPSRGHKHSPIDCWRTYPDGLRAMAVWAGLTLLESHVHYPPRGEKGRHIYAEIDSLNHYWGDTVGVFKKAAEPSLRKRALHVAVRAWANKASAKGPLGTTPDPRLDCRVLPGDGTAPRAARG